MSQLTLTPRSLPLRAQLRLALLAAAETCWIYAAVFVVSALAGAPRVVSPFGIFLTYWIALQVGRFVPRAKKTWRILQALTIAIAFLTILVVIRLSLYDQTPFADLHWLSDYFARLTMLREHGAAEQISTLALVFTFARGLSMAQRPLTLWTVGYQFRLGIVVFFVAAIISALSQSIHFGVWVFIYFGLSLPAIALARIEEAGQERPFGGKWALVMLSAIGAVMLLGFAVTQFFTLDAMNRLFEQFSPLGFVVRLLVALVAIPIFLGIELLARLLAPLLDFLRGALQNSSFALNGANADALKFLNQATRVVADLTPYLRIIGVALAVVAMGWLIARALNKRVERREREMFVSETIDDRENFAAESKPRPKRGRFARREIHAENVRRIYAALLVQAENAGLERQTAETPLEFLPRLTARFPDIAPALSEITNAYIAVHYAQRPATDAQARALRALWTRVKPKMTNVEKK